MERQKETDICSAVKKYWLETYGCQMNVRDSEIIAGLMERRGYQPAASASEADFILFNTCCVRDHAEKRLLGNVGALRARKEAEPELVIGVCGCMMQQQETAQKLFKRFPYVNLVFGTHMLAHFDKLLAAVEQGERVLAVSEDELGIVEGLPSVRPKGVSAFVNINYGCNNFCTYCIVPYVRGRERSRKPDAILQEIEKLAQAGYSEVTLLGQNVNSYGQDLGNIRFPDLLSAVNAIDKLKRIRFMTSHPKDLSEDMIHAIAALPKVCHHVHLPLQSGSDRVLKLMNRQYDSAKYLSLVQRLKELVPDVELTTDIIVGFPGETEEDFSATLNMVERVGYLSAFTFKYSPRKGTVAATMGEQIDESVKSERLNRLNQLQARKTAENNAKYVGHGGEVLTEGFDSKTGCSFGKLNNFKMVYFPGNHI